MKNGINNLSADAGLFSINSMLTSGSVSDCSPNIVYLNHLVSFLRCPISLVEIHPHSPTTGKLAPTNHNLRVANRALLTTMVPQCFNEAIISAQGIVFVFRGVLVVRIPTMISSSQIIATSHDLTQKRCANFRGNPLISKIPGWENHMIIWP